MGRETGASHSDDSGLFDLVPDRVAVEFFPVRAFLKRFFFIQSVVLHDDAVHRGSAGGNLLFDSLYDTRNGRVNRSGYKTSRLRNFLSRLYMIAFLYDRCGRRADVL